MSVSWLTCMRSPTSSISLTIFRSLSSSSSSSCSCVSEYEWNLFSKPDISPMALLLCVSLRYRREVSCVMCFSSTGSRVIPDKSAPVNGRDVTRVDVWATSRGHSWKKDLVNIVLLYNLYINMIQLTSLRLYIHIHFLRIRTRLFFIYIIIHYYLIILYIIECFNNCFQLI